MTGAPDLRDVPCPGDVESGIAVDQHEVGWSDPCSGTTDGRDWLIRCRPAWELAVMTVVTTTRLRPGGEDEWDAAVRARFESAHDRPGWVSGQLLTPTEEPHTRVIVGTWQSRDDWEAWHHDPAFLEQRSTLEQLEEQPSRTEWFEVVADARRG